MYQFSRGIYRELATEVQPGRVGGVCEARQRLLRDCEAAMERLRSRLPYIRALRDVAPEDLEANADLLDATQRKRASHVVAENARTQEAAEALEAGDAPASGWRQGQGSSASTSGSAVSARHQLAWSWPGSAKHSGQERSLAFSTISS